MNRNSCTLHKAVPAPAPALRDRAARRPAAPRPRTPTPALAALVLLLSGCAALSPGPRREAALEPPAALPAQWQAPLPTLAPAAPRDGWAAFGDALLVQLVDEALAANLDLAAARSALERARALRDVAAAGERPTLGLGGSASVARGGNSLRAGLDASWEPDLFGANADATRAAQAGADAAAATLAATRLAIAAETAFAYLQWQGARAQLAATRASVEHQAETAQHVRWRTQAGLTSALDDEQARAALEQSRARVHTLEATLAQGEHALAVLTGAPPAALAQRLSASAAAQPVVPALAALPQPAELLQRRWDLTAAEWRVQAALAELARADAARKPRISVGGNLALQAATLAALGSSGALASALVASVSWPIVDGGAGRAQVAAQEAALESARTAWRAAVLVALKDVEDALVARHAAAQRVTALERASAAADEAVRLARIQHRVGLLALTTLLDTERSALSAADALAAARTELASAHVRLYKALGGDWQADAAANAPTAARTAASAKAATENTDAPDAAALEATALDATAPDATAARPAATPSISPSPAARRGTATPVPLRRP